MRPSILTPLLIGVILRLSLPPAHVHADDLVFSTEDRQLLLAAGLKPDSSLLLDFLHERTCLAKNATKLAEHIQALGNRKFLVRQSAAKQLFIAGSAALPLLYQASTSTDAERARRARDSINRIETEGGASLTEAIARALVALRPKGAAGAILAYLPFAEDADTEELLLHVLAAVALNRETIPRLLRALHDPAPARRAAAAFLLGRLKPQPYRQQLILLTADARPEVRWQAASSLAQTGERRMGPTLVRLLFDAPPVIAWRAERLLLQLAGRTAPRTSLQITDRSRRDCRIAWNNWWKRYGAQVDFGRLSQQPPQPLFLTLIPTHGSVVAFGHDYKECWRLRDCQGPIDAEILPSGRVLVAENYAHRITERDLAGRIVWEYKTDSLPAACWRRKNGNTVIGTKWELLEVTPDGKKVRGRKFSPGLHDARKLRHNRLVVLTAHNEVKQFTSDLKLISVVKGANPICDWMGISVLPNGHYIVVHDQDGFPAEITPQGRTVEQITQQSATSVDRLISGHLLLCPLRGDRILELDRNSRVVHSFDLAGHPWRVRCLSHE
jgi:HEAT repeats